MDVKNRPRKALPEPENGRTWHWSGGAPLARFLRLRAGPARIHMARSSTGLGPRLLYAVILGATIAAALALRVWDPTPVARLRALVFDTYQRLEPRAFDPALPVRVIDIDEASLKAVGQWPWPRTVLADLVNKLAAGGAAAIGLDIVFPEPDRMSPANALRFRPESAAVETLPEEIDKLPSNDKVFAEAITKTPVVLGFIAAPQGTSLPETMAGFAHGGDDPKLFELDLLKVKGKTEATRAF